MIVFPAGILPPCRNDAGNTSELSFHLRTPLAGFGGCTPFQYAFQRLQQLGAGALAPAGGNALFQPANRATVAVGSGLNDGWPPSPVCLAIPDGDPSHWSALLADRSGQSSRPRSLSDGASTAMSSRSSSFSTGYAAMRTRTALLSVLKRRSNTRSMALRWFFSDPFSIPSS